MIKKSMQDIPNAVQWVDGVAISPQYYQDAFNRTEELMRFRMSLCTPYYYGVLKMNIDENLLRTHTFRLSELECIMPDGLEVHYLYGVERTLELDLSQFREQIQKGPQKIYLCVPFGKKIGKQGEKFTRFYISPDEKLKDMNEGESFSVSRYRTNLSISIGVLPPSEFISIPLAIINSDKDHLALTPYTPPSIILERGSEIFNLCNEILRLMKVKHEILVKQYKKTFLDLDASLNGIFYLINIIRKIIPKLEVILHSPYLSPFELYSEIVSVYSQVICIDRAFTKEIIPCYDHENLFEIFTLLTKMICGHIEVEVPDHFSLCYFDKYQDYFKTVLNTEINADELIIGFRKSESFSDNDFMSFIANLLICERNNYSAMRETRSLGFERKYIKSQSGLFLGKNIFLFSIHVKKDQLQKNSEIIIFANSHNFQSLEKNSIILYSKMRN